MIAKLIKKDNRYMCSHCFIWQKQLQETCCYCGYIFSNYESEVLKNYKDQQPLG